MWKPSETPQNAVSGPDGISGRHNGIGLSTVRQLVGSVRQLDEHTERTRIARNRDTPGRRAGQPHAPSRFSYSDDHTALGSKRTG